MQAVQPRHDRLADRDTASASAARDLADAANDGTPLWKRIAKRLGRTWIEGSVMADPVAYSQYLIAKAGAEA